MRPGHEVGGARRVSRLCRCLSPPPTPLRVVKGHGAGRKGAGASLSLFSAERQEKVKISGN